jgi:hypothetical protein
MVDITNAPATTYNWGLSRVASQIKVDDTVGWIDLEIPNNLIINARNEQDIVDGLEQHNAGYIYKPQRFTFSMDVPVNTPTYRFLREVLLRRLQFALKVSEDIRGNPNIANVDGYLREYEGLTEELHGCVFDDLSEPFRVGQLPIVTFNGKALRFKTADDTAAATTINNNYGEGTYDTSIPTK